MKSQPRGLASSFILAALLLGRCGVTAPVVSDAAYLRCRDEDPGPDAAGSQLPGLNHVVNGADGDWAKAVSDIATGPLENVDTATAGYVTDRAHQIDLSVAKSWLDRYYAVKEFYVERDGSTTTLLSCGAVLLAAIAACSRSVETLTTLTGLPAAFVEATLLVADSGGHFFSVSYGRLILAVTQHPQDFDQVEHALRDLFWDICETPGSDRQWNDALSILRARYL